MFFSRSPIVFGWFVVLGRACLEGQLSKISIWVFRKVRFNSTIVNTTLQGTATHPTFKKQKLSSEVPAGKGYVSPQEGIPEGSTYIVRG